MSQTAKEPRRILAPNPSPLTGPGTNTFLIGRDQVAVIDPGPDDPDHLAAIIKAADNRISHIFVTHAHRDHSAGAPQLSQMTGAPMFAFGDAFAGRSPIMRQLAETGLVGGGEGLDMDFRPDILLSDGQAVETPDWTLRAVHTPGHSGGHLSFQLDDLLFCGDIILGWSSTLISPPDGDLADYFRSLDTIQALQPTRLLPAHGDPVETPAQRLNELGAHRRERTAQILTALRQAPGNADDLAQRIYDVTPQLMPAAARNVLAHLVALTTLGAVIPEGNFAANSRFHAV